MWELGWEERDLAAGERGSACRVRYQSQLHQRDHGHRGGGDAGR